MSRIHRLNLDFLGKKCTISNCDTHMNKEIVILLLRRDEHSLTQKEWIMLEVAFRTQGAGFKFIRIDPVDYKEHAELCQKHQPVCVVLPLERPIPAKAMEEGFAHVVFGEDWLVELLPLEVKFKHFEPKGV